MARFYHCATFKELQSAEFLRSIYFTQND